MARITVTAGGTSASTKISVTSQVNHTAAADSHVTKATQHHQKDGIAKRFKKFVAKRRAPLLISVSVMTLVFIVGALFYSQTQRPVAMAFGGRGQGFAVDQPIEVQFSQSLRRVDLQITPELKGEWRMQKNLFGITAARFQPDTSELENATEYTVRLASADRVLLGSSVDEKVVSFLTEFAPGITSVSPLPGSKDIKPDAEIKIVFTEPKQGDSAPQINLEPLLETEQSISSDSRAFSWKPKGGFAQSTAYKAAISGEDKKSLANVDFATVQQPNITQATNKTHFYPEEKIEVGFDVPMKTARPAIVCECEGQGEWQSAQKFVFTPTAIEPGKSYAYTVPKGLESEAGGVREADQGYAVQTPGAVQALIAGSRSAPLQTSVAISFDQPVKRETVQPRLSVEPHAATKLVWKDDKTATVQLSGLDYQTTYTVRIAPGVEPQRFGLTSAAVQSGSVVTAPQTIKLAVPQYRQTHPLSCEESALRMALAYRGVQASDMEILQRVGYSPRPYDAASNSWDNPYEQFVGDVNGSQVRKTGYGVYAPPIAKAARSYGRGASVATGVSANFLAQAIHDGNPVVIWGTTSGGQRMDWNTASGPVGSWVGQHARTLVGVVGKPSAPIGFWVNDPINGSHKYWTAGALISHMNQHGNLSNQAVVVY